MRVFYASKLAERGPQIPLQPISFGMVSEDGRSIYVINEESLTAILRNRWLQAQLLPSLPIIVDQQTDGGSISSWDRDHAEYANVLSLDGVETVVKEFLLSCDSPDSELELWAQYGDFDHVVLSQLFGARSEVPPWIPPYTHHLEQLIELAPAEKLILPPQPAIAHHALWEAQWVREAYHEAIRAIDLWEDFDLTAEDDATDADDEPTGESEPAPDPDYR